MCRRNSTEMKVCPVMCTVNMQQGDKDGREKRKEKERELSRLDYQT